MRHGIAKIGLPVLKQLKKPSAYTPFSKLMTALQLKL